MLIISLLSLLLMFMLRLLLLLAWLTKAQYEQSRSHISHRNIFQHIDCTCVTCFPDVFYYLKDPPPGFLPRFGTITMAGLLGMFLARKGNHIPSHSITPTVSLQGAVILRAVNVSLSSQTAILLHNKQTLV